VAEPTQERAVRLHAGNLGVHLGTTLLIACFFLPWTRLGGYTAVEMAFSADKARVALLALALRPKDPLAYTRVLYMIPLLALATLMLEFTIPPGHVGRGLARISILAAGGTLCVFLSTVGVRYGSGLSYGFWWSLSGAYFVTVGGVFNVCRGE